MKVSDTVEMKSATLQFGTPKHRGSVTMKAVKGRHMVFLFLGSRDVTQDGTENSVKFSAREVLKSMGWIPGPELQAQFDAESTDDKEPG